MHCRVLRRGRKCRMQQRICRRRLRHGCVDDRVRRGWVCSGSRGCDLGVQARDRTPGKPKRNSPRNKEMRAGEEKNLAPCGAYRWRNSRARGKRGKTSPSGPHIECLRWRMSPAWDENFHGDLRTRVDCTAVFIVGNDFVRCGTVSRSGCQAGKCAFPAPHVREADAKVAALDQCVFG